MILDGIKNYIKIKSLERKIMKTEKKSLRHNKRLIEKDFKTYKELLNLGKSKKWVAEAVDRSYFTISMVEKSTDFEDYHRLIKEWGETTRKPAVKPAPIPLREPVNFFTSDFYISVTLRAKGINCVGHVKDGNKTIFEFDISPDEANEFVNQYYNKEIEVNAYDFVTAIHEFRDRIHENV